VSVLAEQIELVARVQPLEIRGVVAGVRGMTVLVEHLPAPVGSLVRIEHAGGGGAVESLLGEVIGLSDSHAMVMPLGQTGGVRIGDRVIAEETGPMVPVGFGLLGRVVDGLGRPIDGKGPVRDVGRRIITSRPLRALARRRITSPMETGVRAIDLMTTLGRGQRLGIFAGPGVGKSTLLGQIARNASAEVNVIALVGERGREVPEFIEQSLGPAGLAKSVVVVATGDEPPPMRVRAALAACAIAEFFRDHSMDAMLMMDSITRFAHAQRQIGLAVGEPPATKGFTPSVFAQMSLLLERAGILEDGPGAGHAEVKKGGSITGLYTILVEGDDMTEPIADAARGILDGHLVLTRRLAQRGHFPAIDVLDSVSRVLDDVTARAHQDARRQIVRLLAAYRDVEELVQIGAYAHGSNPEADTAIEFRPRILALLQQSREERTPIAESAKALVAIALESGGVLQRRSAASGKGPIARPGRPVSGSNAAAGKGGR
jgi:flagellum-specific ATP synthase